MALCRTIVLRPKRFASHRLYSSSSVSRMSLPQILMERLAPNDNHKKTITKLTLNRPKANAMGQQMIRELGACLDVLEKETESSCRCLVVTSFSERVFSAGADLKERATMTEDETHEFVSLLRNTMQRIAELPMPTLAAIDGVAVGGGLELALATDLRIVSEAAVLGLPETTLAIVPGAGGTQRLPRLIGSAKAKELIWTGKKLTGKEAFEWGLANEVVTNDATTRALDLAAQISQNGPIAIRASKLAIELGGELANMQEALEIEKECYAKVVPTQDRLEGLRAFREGRTPSYTGK